MAGHVFISYCPPDRAYVTGLATHLASVGIGFWYDGPGGAGEALSERVKQAIDECVAFIVVLTPESAGSRWVGWELSYAMRLGRPLHPLMLRYCAPEALGEMPYEDVRGGIMPSKAFVNRLRAHIAEAGARMSDHTVEPAVLEGSFRRTLRGHSDGVSGVAVAPDGGWLASSSFDGSVRLWRADGTQVMTLRGDFGGSTGVAIAPGGNWLASTGARTIRLWDTTGRLRATLAGHDAAVWGVAISSDGSWIASAGVDHTARVWTATGRVRAVLTGHSDAVLAVAIAPGGDWLATGSADRSVRIWRPDGQLVAVLQQPDAVSSLAIAPNGSWLAASSGGSLRLLQSNGTSSTAFDQVGNIQALAIAPTGGWIAAGCDDGTIHLWRPHFGAAAALVGHIAVVRAIAIASDGTWLASASNDHTVRIWNISSRLQVMY